MKMILNDDKLRELAEAGTPISPVIVRKLLDRIKALRSYIESSVVHASHGPSSLGCLCDDLQCTNRRRILYADDAAQERE